MRGQLESVAYIVMAIFIVALAVLYGGKLISELSGSTFDTSGLITNAHTSFRSSYDVLIPILFLGLIIIILASSYLLVRTNIAFLPIVMLGGVFVVFGAQSLGSLWTSIIGTSAMGTEGAQFTTINWLMANFGTVVAVSLMLLLIVLFGKPQQGAGV